MDRERAPKAALLSRLDAFRPNTTGLDVLLRFAPEHFEHPESEESIVVYRSRKEPGRQGSDLLDFWLCCLSRELGDQSDDARFRQVAALSLCREVTPEAMREAIQGQLRGLTEDPGFEVGGGIVRALQMSDDWNWIVFAWETPEALYTFFWETSA